MSLFSNMGACVDIDGFGLPSAPVIAVGSSPTGTICLLIPMSATKFGSSSPANGRPFLSGRKTKFYSPYKKVWSVSFIPAL